MCQQMGRHLIGAGRPGAIVSLASTHGTVAFPRLDQHMIRVPAIEWAQHGQRDRTGHHPDPVARARCRVPKSPRRPRVRMVDVDHGKRLAQSVAVFADGTVGRRLRVAAPANRAGSSALTSADNRRGPSMRHGDGGASKHHIRDGVAEALPTRAARQQGCPDFRVQGRFKTPVFSIFLLASRTRCAPQR
jgi:hypothetical protein